MYMSRVVAGSSESVVEPAPMPSLKCPPFFGWAMARELNREAGAAAVAPMAAMRDMNSRRVILPDASCF
ncbi:MAG: hypothetical protein M5U09_02415 [Gammaproteobacteria bacterium]|nr:hypothetical protein [Gammaproteobacteria bacterium]